MAEQRNIPADLVEIGTLARPHGIRGEIRVNYYADSLELLRGDVVYLQAGNKPPRKMEIDTVRMHQGTPLIRFVEAPDRTAAEFLRGQTLLIPESALPELDEDEVYLHDMLVSVVRRDEPKVGAGSRPFHGEQEFGPSSRRKARKSCFRRARICRGHRRYRDHPITLLRFARTLSVRLHRRYRTPSSHR
ncbi:MAG: ribosome maturation factor RimM [Bilophila wadsworthia]